MKTFAILTTANSPLLGPTLECLNEQKLKPSAIIVDGCLPKHLMNIVLDRIDPSYKIKAIWELNIEKIPVYFVLNHDSSQCIELVRNLKLDFLVNAGTPRILKKNILTTTQGIINCHPGILPKYRGCSALEWSIYNNDPIGATVHLMTEKIDEGDVLFYRTMPTIAGDNYRAIRTRMIHHQCATLAEGISTIIQKNDIQCCFQKQSNGNYNKPIPEELLKIVKNKILEGKYVSH